MVIECCKGREKTGIKEALPVKKSIKKTAEPATKAHVLLCRLR